MGLVIVDDDEAPVSQKPAVVEKKAETKKTSSLIPPGYIPMQLSSKGRFGVPETIHVKNFTTEFLIELAMAADELLPTRLISALQSLIWEKDVLVERWPEKLVIELLLRIYSNFFTPVLTSVNFPVWKEDLEFLEKAGRMQELEDIKKGTYKPKTDLDLRNLEIIDLDPKVKDYVVFKKKDGEFSVKFLAYTKLNDSLLIKKTIEEKFGEQEKTFAKFKQMIEIRNELLDKGQYDRLPTIDTMELEKWQLFEAEKTMYSLRAARALNLVEYNGKDVADLSIHEKIRIVEEDPRFDIKLTEAIDRQAQKISFGVSSVVEVRNPISGEVCKRAFTFRYMDILQAVQLHNSDEYDISYDD